MRINEIQEVLFKESGLKINLLKSKLIGKSSSELFRATGMPGDYRVLMYLMHRYPSSIEVLLEPAINFFRNVSELENSEYSIEDEIKDAFFGKDPHIWDILIKIDTYIMNLSESQRKIRIGHNLLSAFHVLKEHLFIDLDRDYLKKNKVKFEKVNEAIDFVKSSKGLFSNKNDLISFSACLDQYKILYRVFDSWEGTIMVEYVHSS